MRWEIDYELNEEPQGTRMLNLVWFSYSPSFIDKFMASILNYISKYMMKLQQKTKLKIESMKIWFSFDYHNCMFVDSLIEYVVLPIVYHQVWSSSKYFRDMVLSLLHMCLYGVCSLMLIIDTSLLNQEK